MIQALSLTQGGPGLHCMVEAVYRLLGDLPDVEMIADIDTTANF